MHLRLRGISTKTVHSDSQLSYLFFQYFGLDSGPTLKLANMGWDVAKVRNNRTIDIRCAGEDGRVMIIRVHGRNGRSAITTPAIMPRVDFWIIVRFDADPPKCYILSHAEIASERYAQKSKKTGITSWYIDPPQYERFKAGWDRLSSGLNIR